MIDPISAINTVLLIGIFLYQHNKNKVLTDRISQQTQLLKDTKSVVTQQATAVESQSRVVETAVRYSEAFNPEKLEQVLRRQLEAESSKRIVEMEQQFKGELSAQKQEQQRIRQTLLNTAITQIAVGYTFPILKLALELMVRVPSEERKACIAEMPDGPIKDQLLALSAQVDAEFERVIRQLQVQQNAQADGTAPDGSAA